MFSEHELLNILDEFVVKLNKSVSEMTCIKHPDQDQTIEVGILDGSLHINNLTGCYEMRERIRAEISKIEAGF